MIRVSESLRELLSDKSIQDMINKGNFKKLFGLICKKYFYPKCTILKQIIRIIKATNIDPNLKNDIPTLLEVVNKAINSEAIHTKDFALNQYYKGKPCRIVGLMDTALIKDYWADSKKVFDEALWVVKFENGEILPAEGCDLDSKIFP